MLVGPLCTVLSRTFFCILQEYTPLFSYLHVLVQYFSVRTVRLHELSPYLCANCAFPYRKTGGGGGAYVLFYNENWSVSRIAGAPAFCSALCPGPWKGLTQKRRRLAAAALQRQNHRSKDRPLQNRVGAGDCRGLRKGVEKGNWGVMEC